MKVLSKFSVFITISLITLGLPSTINTPKINAATGTGAATVTVVDKAPASFELKTTTDPSNPLVSGAGTVLYPDLLVNNKNGDYGQYPMGSAVEWTDAGGTKHTIDMRTECGKLGAKSMPWVAYFPGTGGARPANEEANQFGSIRTGLGGKTDCYNRELSGGPGKWVDPNLYAGWGLSGRYRNADWTTPALTSGGQKSDWFMAPNPDIPTIWKNNGPNNDGNVIQADYENVLFAPDKSYYGQPANYYKTGDTAELRSSGASYIRMEFSYTDTQWTFLNDHPTTNFTLNLKAKADDFVRVYYNGIYLTEVPYIDIPSAPGVTSIDLNVPRQYINQKDNNVFAFQVVDKAAWHKVGAGASANAAGLWFDITGTFTDSTREVTPTCTLSATPTSGKATAPSPTKITVSPTDIPADANYTYSITAENGGATTDLTNRAVTTWYTFPSGTTGAGYNITATAKNTTGATYTSCSLNYKVKSPTSSTGGEVAP
jgi:hypothetical protein